MADNEQLIYPKAFIAQGNGDLVQVVNFSITLTNNAKQVHTLRKKGAGITLGTQESTVSFEFVIDEDGPERNYWADVMAGTIRQLRAKGPRISWTLNGATSAGSGTAVSASANALVTGAWRETDMGVVPRL